MSKIGPNKVSVDPKAYAARVTSAKKRVAQIDPATKAKLNEYYPKITKQDIAKQILNPKTTLSDMTKRIKANPTAKAKSTVTKKAAVKRPSAKPAPLAPAPAKPKGRMTPMPKTTKKAPTKKVVQMPSKISPSKMTPAQKAKYLQNPERYDG